MFFADTQQTIIDLSDLDHDAQWPPLDHNSKYAINMNEYPTNAKTSNTWGTHNSIVYVYAL